MKNIMIIGAGQLGSRHLQGILRSKMALNVIIVDPSLTSLSVAKERAEEISLGCHETKISFTQHIEENMDVDVCIVATTANVRFMVFQELIQKCKVTAIIFEKVLFQKESEYLEVEKLLIQHNISAWVNCTRRLFPIYQNIQQELEKETSLKLSVVGSNWGMACNGIHMIDLAAFLFGCSNLELNSERLESRLVSSKRNGFYEVFGSISGAISNNSTLELTCTDSDKSSLVITISNENTCITVDEIKGLATINTKGKKCEQTFTLQYQSELTHITIEQILNTGSSNLTPFQESMYLHLPFIRLIQAHVQKFIKEPLLHCPIT